jgi:hypothetical protein
MRTPAWHPHTQTHTHPRTSSNSNTVALPQDCRCKARMHARLHSITWNSSGRENAGEASAGILTLNDKKYMVVVGEHPKGSDKNGVTLIYDLSAKVCSQVFPMGLQHLIAYSLLGCKQLNCYCNMSQHSSCQIQVLYKTSTPHL